MLSRVLPLLALTPSLSGQRGQNGQGLQPLEVVPLPKDGEVLVSFKFNETLTDDIRKAIQSGLAIKFVYKVELRRGSAVWFDRTLASASVMAMLRYDTLTRQYQVARSVDGGTEWADRTAREEVAWGWLTRDFARLSLFHGVALEPNGEYSVRVRAN